MVSALSFKAPYTINFLIPSGCPREPNQTGKLVHCSRPLANCGCKYTYQMRYIVHDHCTRWHIHSRRDVSARRAIARRKVVVYTFHPLVGRLGSPKSNNVDVLDKKISLRTTTLFSCFSKERVKAGWRQTRQNKPVSNLSLFWRKVTFWVREECGSKWHSRWHSKWGNGFFLFLEASLWSLLVEIRR